MNQWNLSDLRLENRPVYTLEELGLVDTGPFDALDALTRMARRLLNAPVSLISIVQEERDRQYFTSQQGLKEPWAAKRQTPLSHSFCQHVKARNEPLVVANAPEHRLVRDNLAIRDLDVIAYLGVPIYGPDQSPLGALCVVGDQPRAWVEDDIAALEDIASCVTSEILLRASLLTTERLRQQAERYSAMRESLAQSFMIPDLSTDERFRRLLAAGCAALGFETGVIARVCSGQADVLFSHGALTGGSSTVSATLAGHVVSGDEHVFIRDLRADRRSSAGKLAGQTAGSYAAAPLIHSGVVHGLVEFHSSEVRTEPWTQENASILSAVSMFACANLGIMGEIDMLRRSETELVRQVYEARRRAG